MLEGLSSACGEGRLAGRSTSPPGRGKPQPVTSAAHDVGLAATVLLPAKDGVLTVMVADEVHRLTGAATVPT